MSNIDDTTTGTGPYLNDDAFDFREMTETDKKIIDMSCTLKRHVVLISIEASSMAQITQAINEVSNKIAGGCSTGIKRDYGLSYTFNIRVN